MRLVADPMPILRKRAEDAINAHFNNMAGVSIHRDQAHRRKREIAAEILVGSNKPPPRAFIDEATLLGIEVFTLAEIIADKPDEVMEREGARRTAVIAVRRSRTPEDVAGVLAKYDIRVDMNRS